MTERTNELKNTLFKEVLDSVSDLIIVLDSEGKIIKVNTRALDVLGYRMDDLKGRDFTFLQPEDKREEVLHKFSLVKQDLLGSCSLSLLRHDRKSSIAIESKIIKGQWNNQEAIFCISKDYSKVAIAEEKFIEAFHSNPSLTLILTIESGRIIDANRSSLELFHQSKNEIIGKTIYEVKEFIDFQGWVELQQEIIKNKRLRDWEIKILNNNNEAGFISVSAEMIDIHYEPCVLIVGNDITARKKTEFSLLESEKKYRRFIEFLPEMVCEADKDGRITLVNENAFRKLRYTREDIDKGMHLLDLIAPEDLRRAKENFIKRLQKQDISSQEYLAITKDGQRLPVLVHVDVVRDDNQITGFRGVMIDISDRKKVELKLLNNLKRQELFSKISLSYNSTSDLNKLIEDTLETFSEFLPFTRIYFNVFSTISFPVSIPFHEYRDIKFVRDTNLKIMDISKEEVELLQTQFTANQPYYMTLDGSKTELKKLLKERGVHFFAALPVFINNRLFACFGFDDYSNKISWDDELNEIFITISNIISNAFERYLMDHSLKVKEATSRAIFDAIPDLLIHCNREGIILEHNATRRRDFNIFPMGQGSETLSEHFSDEIADLLLRGIHRSLELGEYVVEYRSKVSRQNAFFEARFERVNPEEAVILIRNVTKQKRYEKELKIAKEKAESASRAKSEFLANVSHEIRTPLNAILGFSEVLFEKFEDSKYKSQVSAIVAGGRTLSSLINDILDLSKIEAGKLEIVYEPVSLSLIFSEIKQIFEPKATEKNIPLIVEFDQDFPNALYLDEVKIRQILFNLVGNSIKFTEAGHIKMNGSFAFYNKRNEGDLVIAVEDTGIGIPRGQQKVIFEAFRQQSGQSSRKYGGTGLGLTITKKLVERMNGSIQMESRIWKGTKFKIFLPGIKVASGEKARIDHSYINDQHIVFDEAIVLVIDDIDFNIEAVKSMLSNSKNLKIIKANGAEEGIKILKNQIPDLILMDLRMPGMDGVELNKKIKRNSRLKETPVIAFTASVITEKDDPVLKDFDGYLRKPVNKGELFRELKKYISFKYIDKEVSHEIGEISEPVDYSNIGNIEEILSHLNEKFIPRWKNLKDDLIIYELEVFAQELYDYSLKYEINILKEYCETIIEELQNFEIDKIERKIKDFPKLMDRLQQYLNK